MADQNLVQNAPAHPTQQISVVDELKNELGRLKDKLKNSQIKQDVFDTVTASAKIIQNKLNELIGKAGGITQSDVDDAYETLKKTKQDEFDKIQKKSRRKILLYVGLGLVAGSLIYILAKKK